MKRLFLAFLIIIIIVFGIWLIAIPSRLITNQIESSLSRGNIKVETNGFKKGLFYSFSYQNIKVKKSDNILLSMDNVVGRINPFSLLLMRLTLSFDGDISGGKFAGAGTINLLKSKNSIDINIGEALIEGMPLFEVMGLGGRGILSGEFKLKDGPGELKFSIKDAQLKNTFFSGAFIPLNMFQNVRGAMTISGDTITVNSLSLEGEGIYARVKGNIVKKVMDLTIEIMQISSSDNKSPVFLMLDNYKVSPGYYVIPVRGNAPF